MFAAVRGGGGGVPPDNRRMYAGFMNIPASFLRHPEIRGHCTDAECASLEIHHVIYTVYDGSLSISFTLYVYHIWLDKVRKCYSNL